MTIASGRPRRCPGRGPFRPVVHRRSLVEERVACAHDLVERPGVATGIGVAAAPGFAVKRANHLLVICASRHAENVVRLRLSFR